MSLRICKQVVMAAAGKLVLCVVVVVAAIGLTLVQGAIKRRPEIFPHDVRKCPGPGHMPNVFLAWSDLESGDTVNRVIIGGTLNLTEPWQDVNVTVKLVKCKKDDVGETHTCENEGVVKEFPGFCEHMYDAGYPWSNIFVDMANKTLKCPLKGVIKFFTRPARLNFLWKLKVKPGDPWNAQVMYIVGGKEVGCIQYTSYRIFKQLHEEDNWLNPYPRE